MSDEAISQALSELPDKPVGDGLFDIVYYKPEFYPDAQKLIRHISDDERRARGNLRYGVRFWEGTPLPKIDGIKPVLPNFYNLVVTNLKGSSLLIKPKYAVYREIKPGLVVGTLQPSFADLPEVQKLAKEEDARVAVLAQNIDRVWSEWQEDLSGQAPEPSEEAQQKAIYRYYVMIANLMGVPASSKRDMQLQEFKDMAIGAALLGLKLPDVAAWTSVVLINEAETAEKPEIKPRDTALPPKNLDFEQLRKVRGSVVQTQNRDARSAA